ncbi:MAG: DUF3996 domain-containing protein [Spirochaetes bacterium]|nr:DUF3996 domain-containing protein [Spirochaetota bacterium]
MKKRITITLLILGLIFLVSSAYGETAVGIIIGEPTGLSFRIDNFPIIGLGYSFAGKIQAFVDWHLKGAVLKDSFSWYLGAGGRIGYIDKNNTNELSLGVRVPIGILYKFKPFETFVEIAPVMYLLPATEFKVDFGIGIRFILD